MGSSTEAPHIVLVAPPGCLASAIAGSLEAFAIASVLRAGEGPGITVEVAAATTGPVVGFGGLVVPTTTSLDAVERADAVVLPPIPDDPSSLLSSHQSVIRGVERLASTGAVAGAACTGTFLLAETGRLDGRRATTTPDFCDQFEARYPDVRLLPAMRVVEEDRVVTAGATTSYLDLALSLIGRWLGPRITLQTARMLSTDPNPRLQQPYLLPRPPRMHPDDEIRRVEQWIGKNLTEPSDTESLARLAGLGRRTFLRRFRIATGASPRQYLQRLRVEAAMKDLEATNLSIEQITTRCGYQDPRSFRRLFRAQTGISPAEHRRRFGFASPR